MFTHKPAAQAIQIGMHHNFMMTSVACAVGSSVNTLRAQLNFPSKPKFCNLFGFPGIKSTQKSISSASYLPLWIDFGSGWNHNHIGKLLGQKMMDEIDYFVPMPWNFFGEEFCNIYVPDVAWSHTMVKNAKSCRTQVLGFYFRTCWFASKAPGIIQWTKKALKGPDPWGITIGNKVNQKGSWGIELDRMRIFIHHRSDVTFYSGCHLALAMVLHPCFYQDYPA